MQAAIQLAVAKLCAFRPARIVGEPDATDGDALADDLIAIATIVDPIIAAIGDYADSTIGIPQADRTSFHHQLRQALEGNATYVVTTAVEARIAARSEDSAEMRAVLRRER